MIDERTDALEIIRCAQINLANLKAHLPTAGQSVFFAIVETQIQEAIEAMEGDTP